MTYIPQSDFSLPVAWDNEMNDEELSATSREEACKVLEQWQSDDEGDDQDLAGIMEVDEQIGSNLLDDVIFGGPCLSPTGPLEELVYMNMEDNEDEERFFVPVLNDVGVEQEETSSQSSSPVVFDEQYQTTLSKLQEYMRRSQETRKSLRMKTSKTQEYSRSQSVSGVISSIEMSSQQLQHYMQTVQRQIQ